MSHVCGKQVLSRLGSNGGVYFTMGEDWSKFPPKLQAEEIMKKRDTKESVLLKLDELRGPRSRATGFRLHIRR